MTPENDDTSDRYETGYARRMMLKEVRKKRKDDMRRLERYVRALATGSAEGQENSEPNIFSMAHLR